MREIKFRAWDKKHQTMYYSDYSNVFLLHGVWQIEERYENGDHGACRVCDEKNIFLMQYTGLKDKNGKDIFEGDIVSCIAAPSGRKMAQAKKMTGKIVYSGWSFTVSLWHKNEWWAYGALDLSTFEIIGNIHENPLEVTK